MAKAAAVPVAQAKDQPKQAAVTCESDLARVRKEHDQCEQQAQRSQQADKAEITRLTEANNKSTQDIQDVLAKTASRPGIEVLGGFPSGAESAALVFLGILVLTAGFFLGWPGRSRGARRDAGAVSAIVALGVYLVSVALLPDTRFGELLLAATAAVLVCVPRPCPLAVGTPPERAGAASTTVTVTPIAPLCRGRRFSGK